MLPDAFFSVIYMFSGSLGSNLNIYHMSACPNRVPPPPSSRTMRWDMIYSSGRSLKIMSLKICRATVLKVFEAKCRSCSIKTTINQRYEASNHSTPSLKVYYQPFDLLHQQCPYQRLILTLRGSSEQKGSI